MNRTITPAAATARLIAGALLIIATGAFARRCRASPPAPSASANEIRALIDRGSLADLRWPDFSDVRASVRQFYAAGDSAPVWIRGGEPTPQARAMVGLFRDAALKGLRPGDYDWPRWKSRIEELEASKPPPDGRVARFDLALTVCTMRYLCALHLGRVNPHRLKLELGLGKDRFDLPGLLRHRLINASDVDAVAAGVEPEYLGYRRAETALATYLNLAAKSHGARLPAPEKVLRAGDRYAGIPQLVARLTELGDLSSADRSLATATVYQGALVAAVRHFQRRHGLEPDGIIGPRTLTQLNTPLEKRVEQLDLTLERYRWIPPNFPQPPIVVNIPEFRLRTMRRQPGGFLSMRVIVGRAYHRRTPVFANYMRYVIFRPFWNVPLSIQRGELVPKIARDPDYLLDHNYEVVDSGRRLVTDDEVSASVLSGLRVGTLHIRQKPGPRNALGLVKFMFPNRYNVYLHGTPRSELFSHARRDFSHGCIRVENPVALATWVLRNQPGWSRERVVATMNGDRTVRVSLARPIPVLILYSTAVVEPDGEVRFFSDIYGYDTALEHALAAGYPYPEE